MNTREVTFEAGGVSYRLLFGMAAMRRYEIATGQNAFAAAENLQHRTADPDIQIASLIVGLFGAALQPQLQTADDVADLIDLIGTAEAMRLLGEALKQAWVGQEASAGNPAKGSKKTL